MAKRKAVRRASAHSSPTNQFNSRQYNGFKTWQKVIFWFGVLAFLNLTYWIVRLILFIVLKDEPLNRRLDAYAMQTYIFGWINVVVIALLIIILSVIAIIGVAMFAWLVPVTSTIGP